MHAKAVYILGDQITQAISRSLNPANLMTVSPGIEETLDCIPGFYGCCVMMSKCPDYSVEFARPLKRHPFLAAEVIYRHQTVPIMLEEAAVLLSRYTSIIYLIQLKILETRPPRRLEGFRIRLCRRMAVPADPDAQGELPLECQARPWSIQDGPEPNREAIELLYNYEVLEDFIVGLADIQNAQLQIPVEVLEQHYDMPRAFVERFITVDLGSVLERICVCADGMVEFGLYPD
jgi:hypothetical protein